MGDEMVWEGMEFWVFHWMETDALLLGVWVVASVYICWCLHVP